MNGKIKLYITDGYILILTNWGKLRKSKELRDYMICAYVVAFLFLYIFYGSLILSATAGLAVFFSLNIYEAYLGEKKKDMLKLQFKDLLYSLSASYASGRQLGEALEEGYEHLQLIYPKASPMLEELEFMQKSINENRAEECSVLRDFGERSGVDDIKSFGEVFATCRATGGNLEKVINKTAAVLIDKLTIEREIKTLMAQKKLEGWIIFAMPLMVIFFLNIVSPDYLATLYEGAEGRAIMTLGMLGMLSAGWMINKISSIRV